jgi:hypothetical protein
MSKKEEYFSSAVKASGENMKPFEEGNGGQDNKDSEPPRIPIATHYFRQRYLFAFALQAEVLHHVRTQALQEEADRLQQIMRAWEGLQPRVADLVQRESGQADAMQVTPISDEHQLKLNLFASDPLFQKTFSSLHVSFKLVEIDKLVAPQRTVNLDYVSHLLESFPKSPTISDLLDICLSPERKMDPIQHLEVAQNVHVFSSPNSDIRFLGAFVKHLTAEDLDYAVSGGLPAAAILAFVGYGGAPVNVLQVANRFILNNGFHRVYALRSIGITEIPVVVQHVRNLQLEFPPTVAGLPKDYLLNAPRPVLIKDFFEPEFAITLKVRERIKVVTMGVNLSQYDVPS